MKPNRHAEVRNEIIISQREKEILQLIYEGNTDGEIAKNLNIRPNTVRTHRENLRTRFNVNNTASMMRIAMENKLVSNESPGK